ncbi:DNA-binding transcriptional LysR family regulator [Bradyrhizobium sp. USDA 4486]
MALGLRQIRYFIAIADAGVLSRAAETLNIAQSALSHHVAALEADLGVKLLERRPRGVALTAAGRRLYEHGSAVLASLGKAEEDVRTFNEAATGPVSLGLSHTAISMVGLELMKAVRKHSPGVHLSVVEALSPALIERVLSGTVDLALAYNPPRDARLDVAWLHEEDLYLVGHPSLIGRSSTPIAFSAIPQRSVLGLNRFRHRAPSSRRRCCATRSSRAKRWRSIPCRHCAWRSKPVSDAPSSPAQPSLPTSRRRNITRAASSIRHCRVPLRWWLSQTGHRPRPSSKSARP